MPSIKVPCYCDDTDQEQKNNLLPKQTLMQYRDTSGFESNTKNVSKNLMFNNFLMFSEKNHEKSHTHKFLKINSS